MDQAWGASAVTNTGENAQSGTRGGVPAVVPGSAAWGGALGGRASGGLTPRVLMLSKLPGKLTAIPSAMRKTLRSQFHTLLYRARQRKSLRVFAFGQRLRH